MLIDLHTHSSVSDGTDAPAELVAAAAALGIAVIALCDHDSFDGLPEALAAGERLGVRVVRGIEISAELAGGSVHLVGYGCDPGDRDLADELARIRRGRTGRIPAMLAKLAELGFPLTEAELRPFVGASPSIGRPHIADAMVSRGYVADRREAFDRWLADDGPAFVPRYSVDVGRGIDLVHRAGGVAVIAHPWGRGSRRLLTPEVLAGLVRDHQLDGIEVDHQDHDAADRAALAAIADRLGLLVTGSSDYHGSGKVGHPLACNTTAPEVLAAIDARVAARGGLA